MIGEKTQEKAFRWGMLSLVALFAGSSCTKVLNQEAVGTNASSEGAAAGTKENTAPVVEELSDSEGKAELRRSARAATLAAIKPYPAKDIVTGDEVSCHINAEGQVRCWGDGTSGKLGQGERNRNNYGSDGSTPVRGLPAISISGKTEQITTSAEGLMDYSCALMQSGSGSGLECWGFVIVPDQGSVKSISAGSGLNSLENPENLPVAVAAGSLHICALRAAGDVLCWGLDNYGLLGVGTSTTNTILVGAAKVVDLGTDAVAQSIVTGSMHSCVLLSDGGIKCWGYNAVGQLGLGDADNRGDTIEEMGDALAKVSLGRDAPKALSVSAGGFHSCAILADGSIKCWGLNKFGQLGLGDTEDRGDGPDEMGENLLAVDLGRYRFATSISAGYDHTCAILDNGRVKCWGGNDYGQLGLDHTKSIGDEESEMGPDLPYVFLGAERTAKSISAGDRHTCAILDDDSVKCWGRNDKGQLGQGHTNNIGDEEGEMAALSAIEF